MAWLVFSLPSLTWLAWRSTVTVRDGSHTSGNEDPNLSQPLPGLSGRTHRRSGWTNWSFREMTSFLTQAAQGPGCPRQPKPRRSTSSPKMHGGDERSRRQEAWSQLRKRALRPLNSTCRIRVRIRTSHADLFAWQARRLSQITFRDEHSQARWPSVES
jgi:hypothetical protein